jgi:hypothetical protein
MYQPPDETNREGAPDQAPGYAPPPRYSHAPLAGPSGDRPAGREPEQAYPQYQYVREGDIEVYSSYEAYLVAQQRKQELDARGVVEEGADRTLSAVAHGAIAFGLLGITLLISLAISGFIWLYGKRSRKVQFHAEQAGCYQLIILTVNALVIVALALTGGFAIFQNVLRRNDFGTSWVLCIGLVFFATWYFVAIAYGIYGAIRVLMGRDFKYPLIGKWIKRRME